ncbi:MAG TPA: flagellin [Terracidiphilus sp.]|nr:flagellin [Terracidiphilus sp.]
MALGVLNNISAIYAQNNLSNTQASLSKTLQQLSSGSRINSGADDAAGLSLANGLQASSTALSQSAKNAAEGVDMLQVADGALSQVTSLLNRAVTLATEASNGTLNGSQTAAADSEYQKILTEIDTINNNTEYNGINTFSKNAAYTGASASDKFNPTSAGFAVTLGNSTFTVNSSAGAASVAGTNIQLAAGGDTLANIAKDINNGLGSSVATVMGNQLVLSGGAKVTSSVANSALTETVGQLAAATSTVTVGNASDTIAPAGAAITITYADGTTHALTTATFGTNAGAGGNLAALAAAVTADATASSKQASVVLSGNTLIIGGAKLTGTSATESEAAGTGSNASIAIFTSDGTISQSYNNGAADMVTTSASSLSLAGTSLNGTGVAQAALTAINNAITTVAADRGTIGANINTLTAVGNVMTTQSTNTLAAMNDVTATDYGQATSDMSKFQILSQTGIAALSQANQSQQLITKLLQ